MLRGLIFYCALTTCLVASMYVIHPGPKYPPTKGEIWPKPRQQTSEDKYFTYHPLLLKFNVTSQTCTILENAIHRYTHVVQKMVYLARMQRRIHGIQRRMKVMCAPDCSDGEDADFMGNLQELQIELTKPCENYPSLEMDERYSLDVGSISKLKSESIWGILRGLETFSQLFYISDDLNEVRINMTSILDYPRYPHRGLLLDTSRHYISLVNILIILDGMAMNKMNVFHWHIVDDQSFPFQSEKFPDLSKKGAFAPNMIYTKNDVQNVVAYARDRGTRVIPEFDVPGHTASWGVTYPNILTQCYENDILIGLGPMNPINTATYKVINELFKEVQDLFPDRYFHVGGDEVELECWSSNPEILGYMFHNNITSVNELHALFMRNTIPLLGERSKPIVWQALAAIGNFVHVGCHISSTLVHPPSNEDGRFSIHEIWPHTWTPWYTARKEMLVQVSFCGRQMFYLPVVFSKKEVFDNNVSLTNDTIVQVWKGGADIEMRKILKAGKRVLYSSGWYLDHLNLNWEDYYKQDPLTIVGQIDNPNNVIGGEACMWGEMVDDRNVVSRIWPRASAVAERLWSELGSPRIRDLRYSWREVLSLEILPEVYHRLEEHTCRMIARGIGAQPPSGPGFCVV